MLAQIYDDYQWKFVPGVAYIYVLAAIFESSCKMNIKYFLIIVGLASCLRHDNTFHFPSGGYEFPTTISTTDSNFYFYGIKNLQTPADSLRDAFFGQKMFMAFNEPNLSIKPAAKVTFRLTSEWESMIDYVITIVQDSIIIKKRTRKDNIYKDNMSELERSHVEILFMNYPIIKNNKNLREPKKQYVDSLINLYPILLDRNYYRLLLNKMYIPYDSIYTYSTTKIPITEKQYINISNLINLSGYWEMSYHFDCKTPSTDGGTDILEVNTGIKYNIVKSYYICSDSNKYLDVLAEIKKIAKVQEEN